MHENWCIKNEEAILCRKNLFTQFSCLEDFLNFFLEEKTPISYEQIIETVTSFDSDLKKYELYANEFADLLGLTASSRLLDDMTYTAKPTSLSSSKLQTVRGAITRDDVVNSIDFEQDIIYANDGFENFLTEGKQQQVYLLYTKIVAKVPRMLVVYVPWESCHKFMVQTKIVELFDEFCHHHLTRRISIMKSLEKILLNTSSDNKTHTLQFSLLTQSLLCIDNSIMCNVDTLCGITRILHNVCIASIGMKTLEECGMKKALLLLTDESMKWKLRAYTNKHKNPFAHITTSIAKVIFQNMFVTSMHNYLKTKVSDLPVHYCQIATSYDFDYPRSTPYQYHFKNETMQIFEESPNKVLLNAFIHILILKNPPERENYLFIRTLSYLESTSEETWSEVQTAANDSLQGVSEDGRLLVISLLRDILFHEEDHKLSLIALQMITRELTLDYV